MKKIIGTIIILALGGAGGYYIGFDHGFEKAVTGEKRFTEGEQWHRHTDTERGVQFTYRVSPDGYVLEEHGPRGEGGAEVVYFLMLKTDYDDLKQSEAPREGPPAISVSVFRNEGGASAREWADAHPNYSLKGLALTDAADMSVAGAEAVRYRADGLYVSDNIVAAHGGFIYLVSGSFLDEESTIRKDFEPFVSSLAFIFSS